jgi:hypothetical protein
MLVLLATRATGGNGADQAQTQTKSKGTIMKPRNGDPKKIQGYAPVNRLKMYYEIDGTGDPLVFIPPAFGFAGQKSFLNWLKIIRSLRSISREMVARRTSRSVRFQSSSTPKTLSVC